MCLENSCCALQHIGYYHSWFYFTTAQKWQERKATSVTPPRRWKEAGSIPFLKKQKRREVM
jgi:hypothetical protein